MVAELVVLQTSGCRSARLLHGVESSSAFVLLVAWDSVEHHQAATATASRGGAR